MCLPNDTDLATELLLSFLGRTKGARLRDIFKKQPINITGFRRKWNTMIKCDLAINTMFKYNGNSYASLADLLRAVIADKGNGIPAGTITARRFDLAKSSVPAGAAWEDEISHQNWSEIVDNGEDFAEVNDPANRNLQVVKNKGQINRPALKRLMCRLLAARITNRKQANNSRAVALELQTPEIEKFEGSSNTNYFNTLAADQEGIAFTLSEKTIDEVKMNCPVVPRDGVLCNARFEARIAYNGKNALGMHGVDESNAATTYSSTNSEDVEFAKTKGGYVDTDSFGKERAYFFHNVADTDIPVFRSFMNSIPAQQEWDTRMKELADDRERRHKLAAKTEDIRETADANAYATEVVKTAEVKANAQSNLFTAEAAAKAAPMVKQIMVEFGCTLLEAIAYLKEMQK